MAGITIKMDEAKLKEVQNLFSDLPKQVNKILSRSINKTLSTVKTQAAARVGNDLNLPAARIKKDMSIRKAYPNSIELGGSFDVRSTPPGLINFGAVQTLTGVKYKVWRKKGASFLPGAFIGTGKNNNTHVFIRHYRLKNKPKPYRNISNYYAKLPKNYRLKIKAQYGPSVASVFMGDRVFNPVSIQAQKVFENNVDVELSAALRGY